MGTTSQNEAVKKWLESGKSIDPLTALEHLGIFRLGARCFDLRKQGLPITTTMVEKNGKRFASYKLEQENGSSGNN